MNDRKNDLKKPDLIHRGAARGSPYPTSRLAPAFGLVELAAELEQADLAVRSRTNAQLSLIAEQIRQLQSQARDILEKSQQDMDLHKAQCNFSKVPGKIYHLYRQPSGTLQFCMLSPGEWGGNPPQEFIGSYRLEIDRSWTPVSENSY